MKAIDWNSVKKIKPLFFIAALVVASCGQKKEEAGGSARKALFVIVDGIPSDVIERVNTPWIDSIAAVGGYTQAYTGGEIGAYSETPTISAVCYANLVTGTWVNKHNVWDNNLEAPNYHYPTVFRYLKDAFPEKTIGVFSTWEDNRTKLIGEGKPETGGIKMDFFADGYERDTVNYQRDAARLHIHRIDERVSKEAAAAIRRDAPDLSWVYLQYTDDVGHLHGNSPQMDSAVVIADNQVGRLWEAVQYRQANFGEEWLVYIVTDHGRDDRGYGHGGQSARERGVWFASNDKNLNDYFHDYEPALVDVMPTLLRFMGVDVPREYRFEWDGIPLSGEVSHIFNAAALQGDSLVLEWEVLKADGDLKVWVSTANKHAEGGADEYIQLAGIPLSAGRASLDVRAYPSDFYKVVLESPAHTTNRWVFRDTAQRVN